MRDKTVEYRILQDKNPRQAFYYTYEVMEERWPEVEQFIMKDPYFAFMYAKYVVKSRWIDAESFILKNIQYSYYYAYDVIKGRWLALEAELFEEKCEIIAKEYCKRFASNYNKFTPLWLKYYTNEFLIIEYFK